MLRARPFHLGLLLAIACAPKTTIPIGTHPHPAGSPAAASRTLLVLLPGRGDLGEDYARHGFVARAHAEAGVDVITVDAHFGYYADRTIRERLHEDVLAPARGRYEHIWLLGISMGGIGALLTAEKYPDDVDGLLLIAPYLGRRRTIEAVMRAGGLAKWQPPADLAWDERLWAWMKSTDTPIYLAYGTEDFGARAHVVLAAALPKDRVLTAPGEHAWTAWTPLFDRLLDEVDELTPPE
ncbi:MAG: alpha/beta hydrolase [Deltaproteobacteria bacterium]|nr:alpha/beta hydrolase [Deltaproteobacteria bacterium]